MEDVEIVVFNDKSWVRLTEYQKVKDELKQDTKSLAKRIYELQSDLSREKVIHEQLKEHCDELELINQKVMEENEQLKQQIEKMKCCYSCISLTLNSVRNCKTCDGNFSEWRLAE